MKIVMPYLTDDEFRSAIDEVVEQWRAENDTTRSANSGSVTTSRGVSTSAARAS